MVKEREIVGKENCIAEMSRKVFELFDSDIYLLGERQVSRLWHSKKVTQV